MPSNDPDVINDPQSADYPPGPATDPGHKHSGGSSATITSPGGFLGTPGNTIAVALVNGVWQLNVQRRDEFYASDDGIKGDFATDNAANLYTYLNSLVVANGAVDAVLSRGTMKGSVPFVIPTMTQLRGMGKYFSGTGFELLAGANCDVMQMFKSPNGVISNAFFCALRDMFLDGNKANQSITDWHSAFNCTTNPYNTGASGDINFDIHHHLENLFLENSSGEGMYFRSRGEVVIDDVWSAYHNGAAFILPFDSHVANCKANNVGLGGVYLPSGDTHITNMHSYNNGATPRFVSTFAQETSSTVWVISNQAHAGTGTFTITLAGVGTTAAIAWNASAATIATAVSAISGFSGTCTGSGGPLGQPGSKVTLTFSVGQTGITIAQSQNWASGAQCVYLEAVYIANSALTAYTGNPMTDTTNWTAPTRPFWSAFGVATAVTSPLTTTPSISTTNCNHGNVLATINGTPVIIPVQSTAAAVETLINAALGAGTVTGATGGPLGTANIVLTFAVAPTSFTMSTRGAINSCPEWGYGYYLEGGGGSSIVGSSAISNAAGGVHLKNTDNNHVQINTNGNCVNPGPGTVNPTNPLNFAEITINNSNNNIIEVSMVGMGSAALRYLSGTGNIILITYDATSTGVMLTADSAALAGSGNTVIVNGVIQSATALTQLAGTNNTTLATTAFVEAAAGGSAQVSNKPQDFGYLGWSIDPAEGSGGSTNPTAGFVYLIRFRCTSTGTLGHVFFDVSSGGTLATANENFIGLYDTGQASAGVATLLGTSADQSSNFDTGALYDVALTPQAAGSLNLVAGQDYFFAILCNNTGGSPSFQGASYNRSLTNAGLTQLNLRQAYFSTGGKTALPTTIAQANIALATANTLFAMMATT
ncbi:MAG TPA: hypothetical protein VG246_12960 [Acidimicrobiales bacterium]|jgi:hypothetical protein|nr:hypothetical protein [Acidimicrobiales bacterium]